MSFAILANALTMILCMAVLVQSVRMMRSLRTVKDGALTETVTALEKATAGARAVLSEMKSTLGTDCAQHARLVDQARGLRDELSDMIGIADAACERVVNAVSLANAVRSSEATDAESENAEAKPEAELA
ncbi:DUF6468 domain-containing protein [Sphingomonas psychrotolerans]|uniref:DUF6468 domain-containing protein n=1 Tax=Sphingomonas psychrotolerans TaxID=1327635 RepID=A0ABU3N2K1_9SPHN|nr:DUF6468 domain-containing protein [Sphingomonas psychrotolerans]MDT8758496.1 DUF6468 domain-containing protein [Sphingomonas psychrotolerans]